MFCRAELNKIKNKISLLIRTSNSDCSTKSTLCHGQIQISSRLKSRKSFMNTVSVNPLETTATPSEARIVLWKEKAYQSSTTSSDGNSTQ